MTGEMDRAFFERDAAAVARDFLGDLLVHGETVGRVVETEAYRGEGDPGSHASNGPTERNATMYGEPGQAYVYLCYGVHEMFNVVTGPEGEASAVLIRALEPVRGLDRMRQRRGVEEPENLTSGPGKLTEAMDIDRRHDGDDLLTGALRIERGSDVAEVGTEPRVGLGVECDRELRFYEEGSVFVS